MAKEQNIKRAERLSKIFEKATSVETVAESVEIIKKEPYITVDEKYELIFLLGRVFERQQAQLEIDKLFQQQKQKEP